MKEDKYILISMDDLRAKSISDVLGNKTCDKIIDYLSENSSASQKDLSDGLSMPINTVEYNIKKLLASGLIKKHKEFFWSKKGKKIVMYELSNKSIIISPKGSGLSEKLKSILPGFMIMGSLSILAFAYEKSMTVKNVVMDSATAPVSKMVNYAASEGLIMDEAVPELYNTGVSSAITVANTLGHSWAWFFAGAVMAVGIFSVVNWKKL